MKLLYGVALLALGLAVGRMKEVSTIELECPKPLPRPLMSDYERAIASLDRSHPIPYRAIVCQEGRCAFYTGRQ